MDTIVKEYECKIPNYLKMSDQSFLFQVPNPLLCFIVHSSPGRFFWIRWLMRDKNWFHNKKGWFQLWEIHLLKAKILPDSPIKCKLRENDSEPMLVIFKLKSLFSPILLLFLFCFCFCFSPSNWAFLIRPKSVHWNEILLEIPKWH